MITQHNQQIPYADVISLWQDDSAFRLFIQSLLVDSPYSAFRWETPAVTTRTANRPFEFVLLNYPALDRPVDVEAFNEHFRAAHGTDVVTFPNLSGGNLDTPTFKWVGSGRGGVSD